MSTDNYPEISIIMGIYNCESTLNEAVACYKKSDCSELGIDYVR